MYLLYFQTYFSFRLKKSNNMYAMCAGIFLSNLGKSGENALIDKVHVGFGWTHRRIEWTQSHIGGLGGHIGGLGGHIRGLGGHT